VTKAVEADDSRRTVTFHLATADPDFVYKLALFVYPTPASAGPNGDGIPPGTGPYVISGYVPRESFALVRNPYFDQPWSVSATPAGYPDVIRWLKVDGVPAAVAAVDSGAADLAELTPLGDRTQTKALLADLSVRRPAQVHSGPAAGTVFLSLNSSRAPFDDVRVRRAVNFAVDRNRLVDLLGGPLTAEPSCQLTIPGIPGYEPYCPYTTSPGVGTWKGPDLETAHRLVRESGTSGAHITMTDLVGAPGPHFHAYLIDVLRDLGYDVDLRQLPVTEANLAAVYDLATGTQALSGGWLPDYPRPADFYDPLVRCGSTNQHYPTAYCDPATDAAADAASELQLSDPGRSMRAWAAVQRTVADQAPFVFVATSRDVWYTGPRVGNYQQAAIYGPLFSQIWVQ
jgi:ABC-type transport system substrate-binding protein